MNMKLHPITLRFSDEHAHLEALFQKDYCRVSLPAMRLFGFLGAVLYASFGILDAYAMPEQKNIIWFIRFIMVGPVLLGVLLISFTSLFRKHMQPILASLYVLAGAGIVVMIVVAPPPVSYSYYAGMMLVFMWGYTLIRLLFIWASLAGWFQVALYEITAVFINPTPLDILISNNFFFISANLMGMMACYAIEFYARRDFFMKKQLESERENVSRINAELEEKIAKRTEDYRVVNRALQEEIAGHRQAEKALRESEEHYRALVENASDMVFRTDIHGRFTFANVSTIRVSGYDESDIIGKHYLEFLRPDMREDASGFFNLQITNRIRNTYSEYPVIKKDGSEIWLEQNTQLITEDGKVIGFQSLSRDVTKRRHLEKELKKSEERYRELSIIDELTQLYNSRHFYSRLQMELDRMERHAYPVTLLLLDIDDFKVFNDTYGHIEGDRVLRRLGQVIKRCLRKEDSAYRYGGEEFTIILPMTAKEEGAVTAERIREELKKENFSPLPDRDIRITVSIGLAEYEKNENIKSFIDRADHCMYRSKRNGKDRNYFE